MFANGICELGQTYHRPMKIRLVPLGSIRKERELRNAEDLASNVLDAHLPHGTTRIRKGAQGQSVVFQRSACQRVIDPRIESNHILLERMSTSVGVSSVLQGIYVEWCVIGGVHRTSSDADEDHESFGYTGDHFAVDCDTSSAYPVS